MNCDCDDIIIELSPEGQDGRSVHPMGEWSSETEYRTLDLVSYQGSSYIALKTVPEGTLPTDTEYWMVSALAYALYWGNIQGVLSDQTDLQDALDAKADAADVYTKTEADALLDAKADKADTYTKTEDDALLALKADQATTYTKTETDALLADKADADDVYTKTATDALLADKADADTVYTKAETDTLLSGKADVGDSYTKAEADALLDAKADTNSVYTKTEADALLAEKANASAVYTKTEADTLLADKASTTDLGGMAYVNDAPSDDKQYVRKNADWEEVVVEAVEWGNISGDIADQTDLQGALDDKADVIISSVSGAVASFSDGADGMPVAGLTVGVEPVQAGSGDPAPDNVRPISGWTGANVYHEDEYDAEAEPTLTISWQTEAGTVYGGTLDVLTGMLTVDRQIMLISDLTWTASSSSGRDFFRTSNLDYMKRDSSCLTSNIPFVRNTSVANMPDGSLALISAQFRLYDTSLTDSASLVTKYGTGQIVYELAAPLTYQLTPAQLTTLIGENAIWADTGDVNVTYRTDTKRYIDFKVADTAKVTRQMIADSATADGKAPKSLSAGDLIIVGDELRKATANIGNGSAITASNSTIATLADVIKALQ